MGNGTHDRDPVGAEDEEDSRYGDAVDTGVDGVPDGDLAETMTDGATDGSTLLAVQEGVKYSQCMM